MRRTAFVIFVCIMAIVMCACGDADNSDKQNAQSITATKTAEPKSDENKFQATSEETKKYNQVEYGDPMLEELAQCSPYDLYEQSMAVANSEQKKQLKAIRDDLYFGYWEEAYTRRIKTIMGLISEDAPYLTVEQAAEMIQEMKEEGILEDFFNHIELVRDRFNEIALAPDMDGGSGITDIRFSVDAEHTGYIQLHSYLGIRYRNIADNTWTVLYQAYGE